MNGLVLVIHEKDNVAVALFDIAAGTEVDVPGRGGLNVVGDVPCGHKIALEALPEGTAVVKYGEEIGRASRDVQAGELVHTHNMGSVEVTE